MFIKEQERACEAEERARSLAVLHEERVANLEARLAELSTTVGNYDRLRQSDQQAIDKLKVISIIHTSELISTLKKPF